eukprot:TRINITY_DN115479_c0_g1_i1.p1 TRINITY_DN115479_c0_g1~~TRINITY_DN115479_c0_g1_i1.p1  ORF type:complete len:162 (-),score=5.06 TRINITY_DN115479_c0_g1_i1:267-752(-)
MEKWFTAFMLLVGSCLVVVSAEELDIDPEHLRLDGNHECDQVSFGSCLLESTVMVNVTVIRDQTALGFAVEGVFPIARPCYAPYADSDNPTFKCLCMAAYVDCAKGAHCLSWGLDQYSPYNACLAMQPRECAAAEMELDCSSAAKTIHSVILLLVMVLVLL